jgi:hypothetical protein
MHTEISRNIESTIDIDLNEFTKEQLMDMIIAAHTKNETFNEFVVRALTQAVQYLEDTEPKNS